MQSSSNIIKTHHSDEVKSFMDMGLPEFHNSSITQEAVEFSISNLPDFTSGNLNIPTSLINELVESTFDHPFHQSNHSTLHVSQAHTLVNGWEAPTLQGIVKSRVSSATPNEPEDLTHLLIQAKEQAAVIIADANQAAAQILANAQKEVESLKQKAFMEGMNAAKAETAQSMHQVERVFQETQLWQEQVMHKSQGRIMEMIVEIGRKLFGNGFDLSAEQIDHIVSRAINEGSRLGDLRIYLNPEDSKILVNLWQESEITVNGQRIQIVSSQNISRGGCFIDGQFGIVDGRVEEQMDQIITNIKPVMASLELDEV
jgi:flagellar assembly protein FliH